MENIANSHPELWITKETIVNMLTVTRYEKRAILEKSLRDIANNPLNMKDNIWWASTYSHELALKDITNANSLQSLEKILLDPKLEHISFGTTTKYSWRNIRWIVTEYRAGNMTIDYVPRELRDKVKELCQKEPILEWQSINK